MTGIIRELVTVFSFKPDLGGLKKGEVALLNFQTKFALIAGAAGLALTKTIDCFSDLASQVVNTNNLARTTGIALSNLEAMQIAAGKFGVRATSISDIFLQINDLTRDAIQGQGALAKIAEETGIIYKDNNNQVLNNLEIFKNILSFLGKIENEQERIRISSLLFTTALGTSVSDLAVNFKQFSKDAVEIQQTLSAGADERAKQAKALEVSVIALENSWRQFGQTLGSEVFPFVKIIVESLEIYVKGVAAIFKGLKSGASFLGESLTADIRHDLKYDEMQDFEKRAAEGNLGFSDFFGIPSTSVQPTNISGPMTNNITTNVKVEVPEGIATSQEMGDVIASMINRSLQETINQIYNNNPQVE